MRIKGKLYELHKL